LSLDLLILFAKSKINITTDTIIMPLLLQ